MPDDTLALDTVAPWPLSTPDSFPTRSCEPIYRSGGLLARVEEIFGLPIMKGSNE